jgi:hypothetical protein
VYSALRVLLLGILLSVQAVRYSSYDYQILLLVPM